VKSNSGEPSAVAATQVHAKSAPAPNHPSHKNREQRGKRSDGQVVLEAGAANAACVDSAE
jgi:hypothetical protein